MTILMRCKSFGATFCVFHRDRQYTIHNLTRYVRICSTRDIAHYVTRETFSESGVTSIVIEKIQSMNFLILTDAS